MRYLFELLVSGFGYVVLDRFSCDLADGPVEFASGPEVAFPKLLLEFWILSEERLGRVAFEKTYCLRDGALWMQSDKYVNVIWGDLQFIDLTAYSSGGLPKNLFTTLFNSSIKKYTAPVLGH